MPDLEEMVVTDEAIEAQEAQVVAAEPDVVDETVSLRSALQKERDARRAAERERKEMAKRIADIEQAGKPEAERLQAERDALAGELETVRQQVRVTRGKAAVLAAANEANAVTPGVVYRAVAADLEFDDSGEPTNVDDLIATLRREAPVLFRPATGKADAATTSRAPAPNGDWIKRGLAARKG